MPWNKLCGGDSTPKKVNLIVNGVLQAGVAFASVVNNFSGSTQGNYYRYTRAAGSGIALGRSTGTFDFSGNKKLYIEGYTSGSNSNNAGTDASGVITDQANIHNRKNLPDSESTIIVTPTTANEYIYLISFSGSLYGYIKNMWIE